MKKLTIILIILYAIAILISLFLIITTPKVEIPISSKRKIPTYVAAVNIYGSIKFSEHPLRRLIRDADYIIKKLNNISKQGKIKGVLLRIDSPGGSVAASQAIYDAILNLRKNKKVVAYIRETCLSGGYYIASACDKIVAHKSSVIGSIGALITIADARELLKKIGINIETLKSGKYKDIGSPFRETTKEEKKILKNILEKVYQQFIDDVSKARQIPKEKVVEVAEGKIFLGQEALTIGLVDYLGDEEKAKEIMKDLLKTDEITIIEEKVYPWDIYKIIQTIKEEIILSLFHTHSLKIEYR